MSDSSSSSPPLTVNVARVDGEEPCAGGERLVGVSSDPTQFRWFPPYCDRPLIPVKVARIGCTNEQCGADLGELVIRLDRPYMANQPMCPWCWHLIFLQPQMFHEERRELD